MFRNYYQIRDWLESYIPLVWGKEDLGLSRIENLLQKLGNPHTKFKSIHVAGTSGKGSTAFYISRFLETSFQRPVKVGLHVSPHLVDIRER
ncbi:MAG: bifunctional folylpolyglutamate synthase/dihydrofolate synthase, partial [bacterium]|nr:bifunctional folylpolyglutamate synthase/dihydrofolate synthase [bacterium]